MPGKLLPLAVAVALALLALSALLPAWAPEQVSGGSRHGPGAYSSSALGHAGLYELLRRLGRPAWQAAGNARALAAGHDGVWIIAEPALRHIDKGEAMQWRAAPRALLVLPKRYGRPDPARLAWIYYQSLLPLAEVESVLKLLGARISLERCPWPAEWPINISDFTPSASGSGPEHGSERGERHGPAQAQLMRSALLRPLVACAEGILLGELNFGGGKLWVLSDPDPLANHGLGRGENAAFALALLDKLAERGGGAAPDYAPLVFDETVHGFELEQGSPLRLLFRLPFLPVTLLTCASACMFLLAASGRFGGARALPPVLGFGQSALIDNGARLLDYGGHHAAILKRYARLAFRGAASALHAPPGLEEAALAAWLDRIGKARGLKSSCAALLRGIDGIRGKDAAAARALFAKAWDMYNWKEEILYGNIGSRRNNKDHTRGSR